MFERHIMLNDITFRFNSPIFNNILTASVTHHNGFCVYPPNHERCSDKEHRRTRSSAIQDRSTGPCSARWRGPCQERLYRHQLRRYVRCSFLPLLNLNQLRLFLTCLIRYWRIGMMGYPPGGILGREAEGTVVRSTDSPAETGNDDLKAGDRVVWLAMGGYAEYTAVPASMAYVIPSDVIPGVAAAALLQGLTALVLTRKIYQVKRGDWVLVHAAAGGVGLWLCQLLKALGAKTIGTASTAEKIKLAKENGADFMINYSEEKDLVKRVEEITGGQGVNVVYDSIGKDQTKNNVDVVAKHGTIVTYGAAVGGDPTP